MRRIWDPFRPGSMAPPGPAHWSHPIHVETWQEGNAAIWALQMQALRRMHVYDLAFLDVSRTGFRHGHTARPMGLRPWAPKSPRAMALGRSDFRARALGRRRMACSTMGRAPSPWQHPSLNTSRNVRSLHPPGAGMQRSNLGPAVASTGMSWFLLLHRAQAHRRVRSGRL